MAKYPAKRAAKRTDRPNPREDRNIDRSLPDFITKGKEYEPRDNFHKPKKRVELLPRNMTQEKYVDLLTDERKSIIFAMGPAGCGKTYLATLYAIKALQDGDIEKIVITRPAVSVDEQHGFLPGSLVEKMQPWLLPILDVFKEYYLPHQVAKMMQNEVIEIAPLAFMRGRTFKNAIVLFDEAQNATPNQMKMVLTRIGENSRMLITGDLNQHDRGYENNGLKDFIARLASRGSDNISLVRFDVTEVERHPIIEEVLRIYGEE